MGVDLGDSFGGRPILNLQIHHHHQTRHWTNSKFIMGFESTYQWEDPIYSGVVFGSVFTTLVAICYYSLISVFAYASLTLLMAVIGVKIYTYVMVTHTHTHTHTQTHIPCV